MNSSFLPPLRPLVQRAATAATSLGSGLLRVWTGRRGQSFLWLSSPLSPSYVCWSWWEYSSTGGTHPLKHAVCVCIILTLYVTFCVCVTETVSKQPISTQTKHRLRLCLLRRRPCCWLQVTVMLAAI